MALIASLFLLVGITAERLVREPLISPVDPSIQVMDWYMDYQYLIPILLGILGLVLLAFPIRSRRGKGAAALSPRTPTSFGRRSWFSIPAVIIGLIVLITVIAGAASEPDHIKGHYTMYYIDIGTEHGMGTSIYGWFYSIPSLILLGVLIAVAVLNLYLISRPALDFDDERDVQVRTGRTCNVLAVATGALLIHFGFILESLGGTSLVQSQFTAAGGTITSWTSFAALGPVLFVAGAMAFALGVAFWSTVCLSSIPLRQQAKATARVS